MSSEGASLTISVFTHAKNAHGHDSEKRHNICVSAKASEGHNEIHDEINTVIYQQIQKFLAADWTAQHILILTYGTSLSLLQDLCLTSIFRFVKGQRKEFLVLTAGAKLYEVMLSPKHE